MYSIKKFLCMGLGVVAVLLLTATQTACNRKSETVAGPETAMVIAEEEDKLIALSLMSGESKLTTTQKTTKTPRGTSMQI